MDIDRLMQEIEEYRDTITLEIDGEHLWDNYQKVMAITWRVAAIRQEIAYLEVKGHATAEQKKFRTMILDPFIDTLHDVATFESRKITAKSIEAKLER